MNIVFFTHPEFFNCKSIHRYTAMLAEGMIRRGHKVEVWSPRPRFVNIPAPRAIKKWLGYVDQYILFPTAIRKHIKSCVPDTLFVFADQALGPWVPLVMNRPHVIHCHDFLAQRSALGEVSENNTRWTGRRYQSFLRKGFTKGKYFISVSRKTRGDLERILPCQPVRSEVIYNGLNHPFHPCNSNRARTFLGERVGLDLKEGYLLHVGGNQWYKNRSGVVDVYNAWRTSNKIKLPLLLIGDEPDSTLQNKILASPFNGDIHVLKNIDEGVINFAYAGALVFIFPSLEEGFGWPIAEAMAAGCPVLTTNRAPMTEVAGNAAFLIPRKPADHNKVADWAINAAQMVNEILSLSSAERDRVVEAGLANARRFDPERTLNKIEAVYYSVLKTNRADETFTRR